MDHTSSEDGAQPTVLRYTAFASTPESGNPAGVVLLANTLDASEMQRISAEVGYAETAFVTERNVGDNPRRVRIRYFSPGAEVPFCGHATIATAVALAERVGTGVFEFETLVGRVVIVTRSDEEGITAAFTSVEPEIALLAPEVEKELLEILGLSTDSLDEKYPLLAAFAGNWHPILVLKDQVVFDNFSFEPQALRALMDAQEWRGTVTVLHAASAVSFEARNLFPVGSMTEDPATGSAAASLGGYLRILRLADVPCSVEVHQGSHVGRPSLLTVEIPEKGGIIVSGSASEIS